MPHQNRKKYTDSRDVGEIQVTGNFAYQFLVNAYRLYADTSHTKKITFFTIMMGVAALWLCSGKTLSEPGITIADCPSFDDDARPGTAAWQSMDMAQLDPMLVQLVQELDVRMEKKYSSKPPIGLSSQAYVESCQELAIRIQRHIPYAINSEVLKRILSDSSFSIRIETAEVMFQRYGDGSDDAPPRGVFEYISNTLIITWSDNVSDRELLQVLSNELNHAGVYAAQGNKQGAERVLLSNGQDLVNVMEKGFQEIKRYQAIFEKYIASNSIFTVMPAELKALSKVLENYVPFAPFNARFSMAQHNGLLRQLKAEQKTTGIVRSQEKIGRLLTPPGIFPAEIIKDAERCVRFNPKYSKKDSYMFYKLSFPLGGSSLAKMKYFFLDMRLMELMTSSYTETGAFSKTHGISSFAAEIASNIEMLLPAVKEFFFKGFCEKFSELHQVDNYCTRPEF